MSEDRRIPIIARPNGAGKSTFAREFLPNEAQCPEFVNADLIAAGLSPFDPAKAAVRAGRLMLQEIERHAAAGTSFAFETNLSGVIYLRRIPVWQSAGYRVELIFLRLPTVDLAIGRVAGRVQQGGHGIPEDVIRRRFQLGWTNFHNRYKPLVDGWMLYDNSGESPVLIDKGEKS
jgi:predicted ABC-type ATPase